MANRNSQGFGLKAAMRTGNTPSIQGQSKYDIDAGETNAIFNGEPVKIDISATTGGYIVTAAAGTKPKPAVFLLAIVFFSYSNSCLS